MIQRLAALLPIALFVYYGGRNAIFHFKGRKPPAVENLLHLGLGVAEGLLIVGALLPRSTWVWYGAVGTAVLGAIDEYLFHRDIPAEEHALHAKSHLAIFLILVTTLAVPALGTP